MLYNIDSKEILKDGKRLYGELNLEAHKLTYLSGENGIGKTSLLKYFLKNQNVLSQKVVLIDQMPLSPLEGYSGRDLFRIMEEDLKGVSESSFSSFENKIYPPLFKNLNASFDSLSGGQKQLLKIYLGLFLKSDIYLLDEPSLSLDEKVISFLKDIFSEYLRLGKTFLVVDHNPKYFESLMAYRHKMIHKDDEVNIYEY